MAHPHTLDVMILCIGVPAFWLGTIVLLDRSQKLKFQKVRDRGGGVQTSAETAERTEMEVMMEKEAKYR